MEGKLNPFLSFEIGTPQKLLFKFDSPRQVESKFGQKFHYTVETGGTEYTLSATASLNTLVQQHAPLRDKTLTVEKVKKDDKIAIFTVNGVSLDELKNEARKNKPEYKPMFEGKPKDDSDGYDDGIPFKESGTLDDLWRDINKLNKALKSLMERAEALDSKEKKEEPEFPF